MNHRESPSIPWAMITAVCLTLVFVTLRLVEVIDWPWLLVILPVLIMIAIRAIWLAAIAIMALLSRW